MKRVITAVLAVGMFLPLIVAPVACDSTATGSTTTGKTFLKLFANPECLFKYGIKI